MSKLNKKPYKGTRDLFPPLMREREYLFQAMQKTAESFAYEPYDGPLLEEVSLFRAKSGEELINDQIYSFFDRGEREVAIRPEMTPTLARMMAQVHRELSKPVKWYSIPNLMRYERPQRGRLREHWQFNCDIFGATAHHGELEILQIVISLLKNFGASEEHFAIHINDRELVDNFFSTFKLADETVYKLYKLVDQYKKLSEEKFNSQLELLLPQTEHRDSFKKYLELDSIEDLKSWTSQLGFTNKGLIFSLFDDLKNLDLEKYIQYDPSIVRGLDYYTGIVFETFDKHPDNRRAICGGGAYANLLQIFGEPALAGVGVGLGDVTLADFLRTHKLMPDLSKPDISIYLASMEEDQATSLNSLALELRGKGHTVYQEYEVTKFKKLFPSAEKRGARYIGFIGEDEKKKQQIVIKKLGTKEQETYKLSEIRKISDYLNERN